MISLGRAGWDAKSKLQQPPHGLVCSAPASRAFPPAPMPYKMLRVPWRPPASPVCFVH